MTDRLHTRLRLRACGYLAHSDVRQSAGAKRVADDHHRLDRKNRDVAKAVAHRHQYRRLDPPDADARPRPHAPRARRAAVEEFVRDAFGERGTVMIRIGRPPKRAIPFRTSKPFRKITAPLSSPLGGDTEKIELLADGQQVAVAGEHPETRKPYCWHGGAPWHVPRADLPYLTEDEARALVDNAVSILADFGYAPTGGIRARPRPGERRQRGRRR